MDIIFLGTSGAVPTQNRNLPSIIIQYNGEQILFDVGEDIQRRFEEASIKFNTPMTILISHMHGDHIIGLPGLLFRFTLIERTSEVKIIGPPNTFFYLMCHKITTGLKAPFLKDIFEFNFNSKFISKYNFQGELNQKPEVLPINDKKIFETNKYYIQAFPVDHSVPTMGFRFIEKDKPGKFNPSVAESLNIPKRYWKKMQSGHKIKFNGVEVDPLKNRIVGPKRPGLIISYSGDSGICESLIDIARDSDIFICESTYAINLKDIALKKKHLTADQAANIAKKANVKNLILTHISTRYTEEEVEELILKEAKKIFSNTEVAYDLKRIII